MVAKSHNDTSETFPLNFNDKKQHNKWIIITFCTIFY